MFRRLDAQDTENLIIGVVLGIAVLFSLVSNLVQIPVQWQIPFIFLALFAIFKLVYPMGQLVRQVTSLSSIQSPLQIKYYPTNSAFYNDLQQMVMSAQHRVAVTYIRQYPPSDFTSPDAKNYFNYVLEWAKRSPDRSFRRIICIPNDRMLTWARDHYNEIKDTRNYEVRVIEWSIQADALNLALIDNTTVFIAFSGETEQDMRGLSLKNDQVLSYFYGFYNQLWTAGQPLSRFLEQRSEGEPTPASS